MPKDRDSQNKASRHDDRERKDRPEAQHRTWTEGARDRSGEQVPLRLALERVGPRGFSAYAYIDRPGGDERDMILGTVEYRETGLEAYRELQSKLEAHHGFVLDRPEPPEWLYEKDWQLIQAKPPKMKEH